MPQLPADYQKALDSFVERLTSMLGENLYSCMLYGSAVRGNVVPKVSDLNILLVLNESTPDAHTAIADCVGNGVKINLFIIGRKGMARSFRAFPIKFRSIKRNYQLLHGEDVVRDFTISDDQLRFFCEQAIRNLRLRSVHSYIQFKGNKKRYLNYLHNVYTPVFTDISEILRLAKMAVPRDYEERIPLIEQYFKIDASVLGDLLKYKNQPKLFFNTSVDLVHARLFGLLNRIVVWMEAQWPTQE